MVGNPVLNDTFFGGSRLPPNKCFKKLRICGKARNNTHSISIIAEVSNKTVTDWCNRLQSLVTWDLQTLDIPEGRIMSLWRLTSPNLVKLNTNRCHYNRDFVDENIHTFI